MNKFLIALLVVLMMPVLAFAEPGPDGFYVNPDLEQCGYIWAGDEYTEYEPAEEGWERVFWVGSWVDSTCYPIVDYLDYLDELEPCSFLENQYGLSESSDLETICDVFGYEYIGEVPNIGIDTGFGNYEEASLQNFQEEVFGLKVWQWVLGSLMIGILNFVIILKLKGKI